MKNIAILTTFLALTLSPPVEANIFNWLKGQKKAVSCAPLDTSCVIEETVDMVFSNAATREVAQNTANKARQLADIAAMMPKAQSDVLRQRLINADEDPSFLKNYNTYTERNAPLPQMPLDTLRIVLETGPEGDDAYGQKVLDGFTAALARRQSVEAVELWRVHGDDLWKRGGRSYQLIQNWLAEHDAPQFKTLTTRYSLYRRSKQRTYQELGAIAKIHCRVNNKEAGRLVLTTVQNQFDKNDWIDPVIQLYAQSELYAATLYCHGLPLTESLQQKLEKMAQAARDFVIEKYPNKNEQNFVLEAMHDTVEVRTWRELAVYHYVERDDPDAARTAFETGGATQGIYGIGTNAEGNLVPRPERRENFPFETFEGDIELLHRLDPVPDISLRYFMTKFEIDALAQYAQSGYYIRDYLFDYADQIDALWPAPLAQEAAAKAVRLAAEISASDPDYPFVSDLILLRLARLPQPAECALSEPRLQQILDRLPGYRFGDTRVETLLIYLHYLNRTPDEGSVCAIDAAMR